MQTVLTFPFTVAWLTGPLNRESSQHFWKPLLHHFTARPRYVHDWPARKLLCAVQDVCGQLSTLHVGPDQPVPRLNPIPNPNPNPQGFGGLEVGRGRGSHAVPPHGFWMAFFSKQNSGRRPKGEPRPKDQHLAQSFVLTSSPART